MISKRWIVAGCTVLMPVLMASQCDSNGAPESSDKGAVEPAAPIQAEQPGERVEASANIPQEPPPAQPQDKAAQLEPQTLAGAEKEPAEKPDQAVVQPDPNVAEPISGQTGVSGPPKSRTVLTGCLANPDARKGQGQRATPGPGPGQGEGVTVEAKGDGAITVKHNLTHNCCYKAVVEATVKGSRVHISETLSGEKCRCNCSSTIKTIVPLEKGKYTVTVEFHQDGKTIKIHEGKISL